MSDESPTRVSVTEYVPSKDPASKGESLPPTKNLSGLFTFILFLLATGIGTFVAGKDVEAKLVALLPEKAEPLGLVMASVMFHLFVLQWLGMIVNNARIKYNVPWPWLYAEKAHPHAIAYNCAQRAHQHYLEQTVLAFGALGVAAVEFPCAASAGIGLFTFSKIIGNVFGYSSGNSKRKNWGGFGYLGLVPVIGLAMVATLHKLGLEPVEAAQPLASQAVDTASPYVAAAVPYVAAAAEKAYNASLYAAEHAGPYVSAMGEKASPYVEAAAETVRPYMAATYEAASPYMTATYEAATPYMTAVGAAASPYMVAMGETAAPYVTAATEAAMPLYEAAKAQMNTVMGS